MLHGMDISGLNCVCVIAEKLFMLNWWPVGSKPGNTNHRENRFFCRAQCPTIYLVHHWPITVFWKYRDPSFLLALRGFGCSTAVGGSVPGDVIFEVAVGNFSVVHCGPGKKPLTHPHCWTWAQPPWAILTPNPHNLHLNSLLLLSLHFRSLLCQTKTEAGGQLGAGSPWAGWICSHHFLLLETRGIAQLFRNSWPTLHLIRELKVSAIDLICREAGNPEWISSLKSGPSF